MIDTLDFQAAEVTATLKTQGSDQSLDFGSFGIRLSTFLLLACNLPSNDKLPHIIFLGQIKEFPNLAGPLRTQSLGQDVLSQTGQGVFALLDDNEGQDGNIGTDDAATDGLAPAFSSAASAIA